MMCSDGNCNRDEPVIVKYWGLKLTPYLLCKPRLDNWLDNADDDPSLEPIALDFIK